MKQQMFIENHEVDLSAELSALLTFSIDDVADFSKRSTTFSKTIILPGTNKNNQVFGNIFEIGQGNVYDPLLPNYGYNYNASKSAACIIFQDNIQTFKGVIRITQINKDAKRIEYETVVFGDLFLLNARLSGGLLENLDFSSYNHTYDAATIIASWDNPGGSGYYYPLIDYGTYSDNKHDWDIRTLRPSLYVKEYVDKMFSAAGFTYQSAIFETTRFKNHIIPHNRKRLTTISGVLLDIDNTNKVISDADVSPVDIEWQTVTLSSAFVTSDDIFFTYVNTENLTLRLVFNYEILSSINPGDNIAINLYKNNIEISNVVLSADGGDTYSAFVDIDFANGDYINWRAQTTLPNSVIVNMHASIAGGSNTQIDINPGSPITMNELIPKNIRQIDFLVSLVELYNLYVYEDKFDNTLIHIEPYVDFFDVSGTVNDWTYKLNRNKVIKVKPMSELNSKLYKYNYKLDTDYYNDLYNKRYGQGYGSYIFDTLYEFASQENKLELIFAATPLVGYEGEDKIYSTIFKRTGTDIAPVEETTDSIIRILQAKKIADVTSWDILDGATVLDSVTDYGYAGHFDDPDAPTNDLNFGALQELFFVLVSGTLSNTQFNLYWSSYMAEITDKDSKLLSAYFYLKTIDIYNLDFSKYITVDGVLFRLNKITDYNMNEPMDCEVELLKVNYKVY